MSVNVNNFLHSLAIFIASASSLDYITTPRALWRNEAIEDDAGGTADPYSVLLIYPGPPLSWNPLPRISLQVMTRGTEKDATLAQAQKIFEALCESDGRPIRGRTIAGKTTAGVNDGNWKIVSIDPLQRPGLLGPDERGRPMVSFNCEIGFAKTA